MMRPLCSWVRRVQPDGAVGVGGEHGYLVVVSEG